MNLVLANGLLLLMVLLETLFLHIYRKEDVAWREIVFNLNSGHILMWVLRGVEIGAFHLLLSSYSWNLLHSWNYTIQWLFAFVAWDFCFYWLHRFHHKFALFWAVHVIHHEGEHFGLSLGIRNSWYSSLTSLPFFMVLALIGVPLEIFITTSSIHYFIQFYNHNRIVNKSGWLEKIMITPSHHRVHHGTNPEYLHRNFGGTFVWWDKLFGTFQQELDSIDIVYGTKDYVKSDNVAWANNLPFFNMLKLPVSKGQRKQAYYRLPDYFIATAGLLLFGLLLYYIYQENHWNTNVKFFFFSIVFIGTIANGGLSEGRVWGVVFWLLNFWVLAPAFVISQLQFDPLLIANFLCLALHSIVVFYFSIANFNSVNNK